MLKITGKRKIAATRLAELSGEQVVYTRVPRCAYEIGSYTIERDGAMTMHDGADLTPLLTLAQEGLLEGWEELSTSSTTDDAEGTDGATEAAEGATTAEGATEATRSATEAAEAAEDATEGATEAARGATAARDATEAENEPTEAAAPETIDIAIPLTGHSAESLRNLVTMIHSRGSLISKATGGNFSCSLAQVEALKDCLTIKETISHITSDLIGLTISNDKIIFTGFPLTDEAEKIRAFTQLAAQMNNASRKQKRVVPKVVNETNERYSLRIWLLRIGMVGDEFKMTRRVLMEHLSGHTAFRTPEAAEKARLKNIQKRVALRATKANTRPAPCAETTTVQRETAASIL